MRATGQDANIGKALDRRQNQNSIKRWFCFYICLRGKGAKIILALDAKITKAGSDSTHNAIDDSDVLSVLGGGEQYQ